MPRLLPLDPAGFIRRLKRRLRWVRVPQRWARLALASPAVGVLAGRPGRALGEIVSVRSWIAQGGAGRLVEVAPGETWSVPAARMPVPPAHWAFAEPGTYACEPHGILELPGARFWGHYGGVVFSPEGALVREVSPDRWAGRAHEAFVRLRFPAVQDVEGVTASLCQAEADDNFFHWTLEVLPKLHLLEQAGYGPGRVDRYLVNGRLEGFRAESLRELGVPLDRVVAVSEGFHIRCATLVVPTQRAAFHATPLWAARFVRDRLGVGDAGVGPRVFVNRADARFRRLLDFDPLRPLLEERGFAVVDLGALPLRDQRAVFAVARVVAGVHGSGFTNLVWARRPLVVGEVFPPLYTDPAFRSLAARLGHAYAVLVGEGALPSAGHNLRARFDDVSVEPRRFAAWLDALLAMEAEGAR
jgi:hypothetical protein